MRRARVATTLTAALALGACGPFGIPGELGNGVFQYECVGATDVTCEGSSVLSGPFEIPERLAVGSQFGVTFEPEGRVGADGSIQVVPASEEHVQKMPTGAFRPLTEGTHSLLARRGDGVVVDYVELHAYEGRVSVRATGGRGFADPQPGLAGDVTSVALLVGQSVRLRGRAVDAEQHVLAGALLYSWSVADPTAAGLSEPTDGVEVWIEARDAGATALHLEVGEQSREIPVVVETPP